MVWRSMCKSIHCLIYITNPYVFVSLLATTGAASIAQNRLFSFEFFEEVLFYTGEKNCNSKIKGLAIYV